MVVLAFKFAGSLAARQPHVIYQLLAWVGRFWLIFRAEIPPMPVLRAITLACPRAGGALTNFEFSEFHE
jgi:hypothetical protein